MNRLSQRAGGLVVVLVLASATGARAQQEAPLAGPWAEPAMLKDNLGGFAKLDMDSWLKRLDPPKAKQLQADLQALEKIPVADRVSLGTQMSAVLEGLGFSNEAHVYASWALLQDPTSRTALANKAALSCFPPMLRLAVDLDPENPIVHTNLGSCAMSAKQWALAKGAYEKALKLDPKHKNALIGMGQWYLRLPDIKKAFEYFAQANGVHYQPQAEETSKDEEGNVQPPPKLIEPEHNRFGGGELEQGGTAHVTSNKMELPPLPNWPSADAFAFSAEARRPLAAFYGQKMGEGIETAMKALESDPLGKIREMRQRVKNMTPEERDALELAEALKPKWDDANIAHAIQLNYAWSAKKLDEAQEQYSKAMEQTKAISDKLRAISEERNAKMVAACEPAGSGSPAALNACIEKFRASAVASCQQSMALNSKLFVLYRDSYRAWYDAVKPVLEDTYRVQGLWIRQISDESLWKTAVMMRNTAIFSPLAAKMIEEDAMRLAVVGIGASAFGLSAEVCPKEPAKTPPPPEQPTVPKTDDPRRKCPIDPNNPVKIPPFDFPGISMPLSVTVNCTEAEVTIRTGLSSGGTGKAGAVLKAKHRFGGDKSTTVFIGAEGSLGKQGIAGTSLGVKGELGVSLTFSKSGQLMDVGGRAGVSESLSLPKELWKGSLGVVAAIEKGAPRVDFSYSGKLKQLPVPKP